MIVLHWSHKNITLLLFWVSKLGFKSCLVVVHKCKNFLFTPDLGFTLSEVLKWFIQVPALNFWTISLNFSIDKENKNLKPKLFQLFFKMKVKKYHTVTSWNYFLLFVLINICQVHIDICKKLSIIVLTLALFTLTEYRIECINLFTLTSSSSTQLWSRRNVNVVKKKKKRKEKNSVTQTCRFNLKSWKLICLFFNTGWLSCDLI